MGRCIKKPPFKWEYEEDLFEAKYPDWRAETNEYFREWCKKNRDKRTAAQARWRAKHPEENRRSNRMMNRLYRARKKAIKLRLEQQGEPRPDADSIE